MAKTDDVPQQPIAEDTGAAADPDEAVQVLAAGLDDGPVTFTRPGVESMNFQVKDGKISTTAAKRDWLLRNGVGTVPTE